MKSLQLLFLLFCGLSGVAQVAPAKRYNPSANGTKEIAEAIKTAKVSKKHVLIQAGGNWCSWCLEFNRFTTSDTEIDSLIKADFILYHLNYSQENKNASVLARYGYPQRFGFPVFIVLDENGNRLHTQNSAYLQQGRSYNKTKLMEFLQHWNKRAIDPNTYKNF